MKILFKTTPEKIRESVPCESRKAYSCLAAAISCLMQPNNDSYLTY